MHCKVFSLFFILEELRLVLFFSLNGKKNSLLSHLSPKVSLYGKTLNYIHMYTHTHTYYTYYGIRLFRFYISSCVSFGKVWFSAIL